MSWKNQTSKCFGSSDLIFGGHPSEEKAARQMLKDAIDDKAKMDDIIKAAENFLNSKGADKQHIAKQLDKIRNLDF
jgi:uncharacterized membrane protein